MSYFVSSLLWTMAGLIVGYVLGSARPYPYQPTPGETRVVTTRRSRTDVVVGVLLLILAVVSVATMHAGLTRQERVIACQAEFNETFSRVLAERTEAARGERAAQRRLLDVMLDPNSTPESRHEALQAYDESLAQADASRSENPLPTHHRCE